MVTIATYSKVEDAHLARARLAGSGVEASLRDEHTIATYWLYSNAIGGVKVQVADEDEERAREVLALPPAEEGILVCPHCGSSAVRLRELGLLSFLCISAGFILPFSSPMADCLSCRKSFKRPR